jgi:hypothetical protein
MTHLSILAAMAGLNPPYNNQFAKKPAWFNHALD